jgi:hypothetical protein
MSQPRISSQAGIRGQHPLERLPVESSPTHANDRDGSLIRPAACLFGDDYAETSVFQSGYKPIALTPVRFLLQFEHDAHHEMSRLSGGPS